MPDPRRQLVGRRSKASGETFERWISNACEFYLQNGWAHIEKTPEPFHITGKDRDGTVKGYYEKKGQPDYKGILCDGTGIMFEAKHTDGDRIRQNVVTDTQWESLDIYEKFGAHCYVMVSLGLTEEKPSEHKQERVPMVDPCYYCLCRSCINNAESLTVNPEEVPYDWHPCFFCDICNNFDGESPENMEREECHEYVIDDYHARQNRKKFRIVR